ncbi:MAG TPA: hypothetical protein GX497_11335 [Bacillus bacterium]|nr:hypothetical protein [Bacillus sp. (in: firmicutes)]
MEKKHWKRLIVAGLISLTVAFQTSVSFAAYKPGEVVTKAGTGELGYKDGASAAAKFHLPSVAVEAEDGMIYVSDTENHRIRVITPKNEVNTYAGTTNETDQYGFQVGGYKDDERLKAMFNAPKGLALSKEGFLFVVDSGNNAVRVIYKDGVVNTITKDLNGPTDIVIGNDGQLIVSDTLNHRIVEITEQGKISVLAGGGYSKDGEWLIGSFADGKGDAAKFNEPTGLAIDAEGNLYVADTGNQRIRKIDAAGNVTTFAGIGSSKMDGTSYISGGFLNGNKTNAQFNFPSSLAFDQNGNLFVADTLNHIIRVVTVNGTVETVAGIAGESGNKIGPETNAQFDRPVGVTVLKNGKLLIVDQLNNKVRELSWYGLPANIKGSQTTIHVVYKNSLIDFKDAAPKVINGRTLIPLRTVSATFGYKVDWNEATEEIAIQNGDQTVTLKVGDVVVKKGNHQFTLDIAPEIEKASNRTYVPLRFIAEAFNLQVDWLSDERVVLIR